MDVVADDVTTPDGDKKIIDMVESMLHKCKFEAERKQLRVAIADYEGRVAHYTGIPRKKLKEILKEELPPQPLDYHTRITILRSLLKFYKTKDLPSHGLLFKNVNENIPTVQNVEQFKQDIFGLGIGYRKIFNNTTLLMEDPKITFERYLYLKKIIQVRQKGTQIYYISERLVDKELNFINPWKHPDPSEISDKYVFFHAICGTAYTNGLFWYAPNENDFYKWMSDILVGQLKHSSVVVLDNNPLHGKSNFNMLTMYNTKAEMLIWLRQHNVPCSNALNKSELYELIKRQPALEDVCRVDRLIQAYGHEVLRLPTHYEDLSPIELLWQDITMSLISMPLHDDIMNTFSNMPTENYQMYEKQVVEKENEIFALDTEMDRVLEEFMIDLQEREQASTSRK